MSNDPKDAVVDLSKLVKSPKNTLKKTSNENVDIIGRDGSFGDDFNHKVHLGKCLLPVQVIFLDDATLAYYPCEVMSIDNTGRYQIIIVKNETFVSALYYNGAQQIYKAIEDPTVDEFKFEANVANPQELFDIYEKIVEEAHK